MTAQEAPSRETLESLLIPSTATLTSVLTEYGLYNTFMQDVAPLAPGTRMAGPAFTLRYIPGREDITHVPVDNLTDMQRIGIESIRQGEVLVIDAREDTRAGVMGDILATRIQQRGGAGIVSDGAFRDTPAIVEAGIAAYARARNAHNSKSVHYPSDIQRPIACGGVAVFPGDIIVGDEEGVVAIPPPPGRRSGGPLRGAGRPGSVHTAKKIQQGHSIIGVYPPDEKTLVEYEAWKTKKG